MQVPRSTATRTICPVLRESTFSRERRVLYSKLAQIRSSIQGQTASTNLPSAKSTADIPALTDVLLLVTMAAPNQGASEPKRSCTQERCRATLEHGIRQAPQE